jgi:hypothetical protein
VGGCGGDAGARDFPVGVAQLRDQLERVGKVSRLKSKLLWLIVAIAIILGYVLYLSEASRQGLDIDRHASQEIEKAKHR